MSSTSSSGDFLPIMWLVGMRQQIVVDYTNSLQRGASCVYITAPDPIYYLMIAPSLEIWLSQMVQMMRNDHFERDVDGKLSTWLNVQNLYKDFIALS